MTEDPKLIDEIQKMTYEPLLPAEKIMIIGSLLLGLVLLGAFLLLTQSAH